MRQQQEAFVRAQFQLIRSPAVIEQALLKLVGVDVPELASCSDPVSHLSGNIECEIVGDSEICAVSFISKNPKVAATVVNAVVDSYFLARENEDRRRVRQRIDFLQDELNRREQELDGLRENAEHLARQSAEAEPDRTQETPNGRLTDLRRHVITAEAERVVLEVEMRVLEKAVCEVQRENSDTQLETEVGPQAAATKEERDRALSETRGQLRSVESLLEQLRKRHEEMVVELGEDGGSQLESGMRKEELAITEEVCDRIAERILMLRTEQRAPNRVELLHRATPPAEPIARYPYLAASAAALAGFCLPFVGLALFRLVRQVA
jgi:uncharacterized protein involved in exopolysaccharide biosynthesis